MSEMTSIDKLPESFDIWGDRNVPIYRAQLCQTRDTIREGMIEMISEKVNSISRSSKLFKSVRESRMSFGNVGGEGFSGSPIRAIETKFGDRAKFH